MNLFICYDRCSTCQKAKKWLDEQGVEYSTRPIKEQNPSKEELMQWCQTSGLPRKKFVNTSGQLYREKNLKDVLPALSDEEFFALLAEDGMLVKRPIFITEKGIATGFKADEWQKLI